MPTLATSSVTAFRRIAEMSSLPANWDGEGADPLSSRAVAEAAVLIAAVAERGADAGHSRVPFTSAPLPDGGLQVEWLGPTSRIDVEVGPSGEFSYLIKHGSGSTASYEEADAIDRDTLVGLIDRIVAS